MTASDFGLGTPINRLRELRERRNRRLRRRAVARYRNNLGPALQRRYGVLSSYTPQQVRRTIQDSGLSQRFVEYAYLLHCGEQYLLEQGAEQADIDALNTQLDADLEHSLQTASNATATALDSSPIDLGLPDAGALTDV